MLRDISVYFQCLLIAIGDSMQHTCNMSDDSDGDQISEVELQWVRKHAPELLVDNDKNFRIRDRLEPSDPNRDPEANDPEAKRRPTWKEVRYGLIRRTYRAYMTSPPHRVPGFRKTTTEAVRQIIESWRDERPHGFGMRLSESTVYRALGLRRPKKRSRHIS